MTPTATPVELVLDPSAPDLAAARAALERFAAAAGAPREAVVDLAIALDEIVSNIVRCAFPDAGRHEIHLRFLADGDGLEALVVDDGVPFDPSDAPEPAADTDIATARVGGRGIVFVRALMDGFEYARVGRENHVRLRRVYRRRAAGG